MRYSRLSFVLLGEEEEIVSALLWSLGTLGLELHEAEGERMRIEAWFAGSLPARVRELAAGRRRLPGAELVGHVETGEVDWMAAYRRSARPVRVGERLIVDPREEPPAPGRQPGVFRLHLPARRAFGTGGHPSTRLAIRFLERLPVAGKTVIDLGTGTGILAFAALLFGADSVVALDRCLAAVFAAADNRRLNLLRPALFGGSLGAVASERRFDLALVNIRPEHSLPELPRLARVLRPGAEAVFSGLLTSEAGRVAGRLREAGFEPLGRCDQEEWAALHVRLGS